MCARSVIVASPPPLLCSVHVSHTVLAQWANLLKWQKAFCLNFSLDLGCRSGARSPIYSLIAPAAATTAILAFSSGRRRRHRRHRRQRLRQRRKLFHCNRIVTLRVQKGDNLAAAVKLRDIWRLSLKNRRPIRFGKTVFGAGEGETERGREGRTRRRRLSWQGNHGGLFREITALRRRDKGVRRIDLWRLQPRPPRSASSSDGTSSRSARACPENV